MELLSLLPTTLITKNKTMSLNYTDGCVNFRDVGEFLTLITGQGILPPNRILRGGKTDYVESAADIGNPKSIINLRKGHDVELFGADYYHFPIANKIEKYHTEQKEVRRWLNDIMKLFEGNELAYPVLIHCLSGKDRTGIVVAAILLILGVDQQAITEEYLLSDGEVHEDLFQIALDGMANVDEYFRWVDLDVVRRNILG